MSGRVLAVARSVRQTTCYTCNIREGLLCLKKDFQGKMYSLAGGTREAIDPVRYIGNRAQEKWGLLCERSI